MKTLSEILETKIASKPQVSKAAKEIRAKVRSVMYKYTVPVEFVMDMEAILK